MPKGRLNFLEHKNLTSRSQIKWRLNECSELSTFLKKKLRTCFYFYFVHFKMSQTKQSTLKCKNLVSCPTRLGHFDSVTKQESSHRAVRTNSCMLRANNIITPNKRCTVVPLALTREIFYRKN